MASPRTSWTQKVREFPQGFRSFSQDLKLTGVPRLLFLRSEWDPIEPSATVVTIPYLLYRLLFCAYFLTFLVLSITGYSDRGYWLLLATNWTFLSQTIYAVLSFGNVFVFWVQELWAKNHPYYHLNVNWFESTVWFFLNLSYSVPQYISITYWAFVYGADSLVGGTGIGWSLTVHGINAVLSIIDAFVVASPFNVTHFIYPFVLNSGYLLMTGLYEVFGGTYKDEEHPYIYPILNWRTGQVGAIITVIASLTCITGFHFLFWILVVTRKHLSSVWRSVSLYDECRDTEDQSANERKPLLDSKV